MLGAHDIAAADETVRQPRLTVRALVFEAPNATTRTEQDDPLATPDARHRSVHEISNPRDREQACERRTCHRPLNCGLRFSAQARRPS